MTAGIRQFLWARLAAWANDALLLLINSASSKETLKEGLIRWLASPAIAESGGGLRSIENHAAIQIADFELGRGEMADKELVQQVIETTCSQRPLVGSGYRVWHHKDIVVVEITAATFVHLPSVAGTTADAPDPLRFVCRQTFNPLPESLLDGSVRVMQGIHALWESCEVAKRQRAPGQERNRDQPTSIA